MKAGILVILTLALGALAASYMLQDNGYVLVNFRGYVIEMSVPVLAFFLIVAYLAVRALVRLWQVPRQIGEVAARRRVRKSGELITQGYIELGQGNFARGEKLLTKGVRNSETPLLNYLAAARAAHAQGDKERRDNWLNMAAEQEPRARNAVLLARAELELDGDDSVDAQNTLDEILADSPRNAEALRLQGQLYLGAENWQGLETLMPALRKYSNLPAKTLDGWTSKAWAALLNESGSDAARGNELWKHLPKHLRHEAALVAARARSLKAQGKEKQAESIVRDALNSNWAPALVLLYSDLDLSNSTALLKRAENWLRERPDDPELLQTAARLCAREELWGKARSYYESSLAIKSEPRVWHELGQLMMRMGEEQAAFEAFQKGLTQSYGDISLPKLTDNSFEDKT